MVEERVAVRVEQLLGAGRGGRSAVVAVDAARAARETHAADGGLSPLTVTARCADTPISSRGSPGRLALH
jgi:hypothetical protein